MWPGPFPTNELTMPAAEGVRCHKRGHSLRDRSQPLQHRQDNALFWADSWPADLTSENAHLLAKYEELDVLGLGGSAGQQDEPEELTAE